VTVIDCVHFIHRLVFIFIYLLRSNSNICSIKETFDLIDLMYRSQYFEIVTRCFLETFETEISASHRPIHYIQKSGRTLTLLAIICWCTLHGVYGLPLTTFVVVCFFIVCERQCCVDFNFRI